MVLTSIIIGLGITYILIGVGSTIERITGHGAPLRLSWAHATWLLTVFVWLVSFWWWEFRLLALVKSWTLAHYFFIITYAVILFLLAVLLLPREWAAIIPLIALMVWMGTFTQSFMPSISAQNARILEQVKPPAALAAEVKP